jgi:hypothetical protein
MPNKQQWISWAGATLRESAWAPLSVVAVYLLGLAFHLYDLFPPLDVPTHFMGGVAITYLYRSAIKNSQSFAGDVSFGVQIVFALTCTGTTTVLWEFYEFLCDHFLHTRMIRGLEDSLLDMFLGLLGALVLSLLYRPQAGLR